MTTNDSTLPKTYTPQDVEDAMYRLWLEYHAFHAKPDERSRDRRYVIMMPLPNVTGALHMGHAMDNVMQDLLIRWHRMKGDNTLWMPGTDHAGIATQAVVEKRLKELEGLTRHDVGRDGLVERIWRWKDQCQVRIIKQQQRMGCSCDWSRQRFTMDAVCARAVRHFFFRMFCDGLIFRGKRLVNWDVFLQTSVSDDEVYYEKVEGHFWHLKYPVINPQPGEPTHVIVATTRPETMLGDTAVAVHPDPEAALEGRLKKLEKSLGGASTKERDEIAAQIADLKTRQTDLLPSLLKLRDMARSGRTIRLPLMNRAIPLICDEWAKPELGSGCVKITPAHDPNDYQVWTRHRDAIDIVNILQTDGTLNDSAGVYAGLERYEARQRVVADLTALGLLDSVEDRDVDMGHSDRSKTPIEPYLSDQWFVKMGDVSGNITLGRGTSREQQSAGLVQAAIDAVTEGKVRIHPERFTATYLSWLGEKRDWPISRQLWWGHRIPIWSKRGRWRELAPLCDALESVVGETVAVKLFIPDRDETLNFAERAQWHTRIDAEWECELQICSRDENAEMIQRFAQLGLTQDPDVLDTWFSSALWPLATLGWPDPQTAEIDPGQTPLRSVEPFENALDYFYPGSCLVTGRDIITLWVARMVIAGLYNRGEVPFRDVFIHANILDGKGERMSKSKGNGIDPVDIIESYGTDAMRYVLCDIQTGVQDIRLPVTAICPRCNAHNDLGQTEHGRSKDGSTTNIFTYVCGKQLGGKKRPEGCGQEFDVLGTIEGLPTAKLISERFEEGRAFCTKLWNSARFAFLNLSSVTDTLWPREALQLEDVWILDQLNQTVIAVEQGLRNYSPSLALNAARDFFWNALCDWYLELIKPRLQTSSDETAPIAKQVLAYCLDQVLRLFHPFVPFITEFLWQRLNEQIPVRRIATWASLAPSAQLITARWPVENSELDAPEIRAIFADLQAVTKAVREVRATANVPPKDLVRVAIKASPTRASAIEPYGHIVSRLAGISELKIDSRAHRLPGSASKIVDDVEIFVFDVIDDHAEKKRLEAQLVKIEKEITLFQNKLNNPNFVGKAPASVIDEHREKLVNYQASRDAIQRSLTELTAG